MEGTEWAYSQYTKRLIDRLMRENAELLHRAGVYDDLFDNHHKVIARLEKENEEMKKLLDEK